jgi:hypothetical protein
MSYDPTQENPKVELPQKENPKTIVLHRPQKGEGLVARQHFEDEKTGKKMVRWWPGSIIQSLSGGVYVTGDHGEVLSYARQDKKRKKVERAVKAEINRLTSKGHLNKAEQLQWELEQLIESWKRTPSIQVKAPAETAPEEERAAA